MEDIKKTYDDLIYKIAVIGRDNLSFIEDLESFCDHFKDHKNFAEYRIKAKSDMSIIYYRNEVLDKSFDLDLEFLQENSIEYPIYAGIIIRISKSSSILMRTDEVKEYVNQYIINEKVKPILTKLPLLNWYTFHYPQETEHNDIFEKVFSEIIELLGAPACSELSLAERIKNITILHKDSVYNVVQFYKAYEQTAPELRPAVLEEYLSKTPLRLYRDTMKRDFVKMNN